MLERKSAASASAIDAVAAPLIRTSCTTSAPTRSPSERNTANMSTSPALNLRS
jgi:hypothetical protein